MIRKLIIILITVFSLQLYASTDPETPLSFTTASGNGNIFRFDSTGTENSFFLFNMSYSNPYSIKNYNSFNFSGYYFDNLLTGIEYSYSGVDWYNESILSFLCGYFGGKYIYPEISLNLFMTEYNFNGKDRYIFNFDLNPDLTLIPSKYFSVSFIYKNFIRTFTSGNHEPFQNFSAGTRLFLCTGLSLDYNYTVENFNSINSGGININLYRNLILKTGYTYETGSVYISGIINYRNYKFSYCYKYHPYLETTHMAGFSFITSGFSSKPFNSGEKSSGKSISVNNYINVQTCTADELSKISGITAELAEKIITTRENESELTVKGLKKSGCTEKQIEEINKYSLNEIPGWEKAVKSKPEWKKSKVKNKKYKKLSPDRKQLLLKELIKSGISPKTAYTISDRASSCTLNYMLQWIDKLDTLSESEKNTVKTICAKIYS
ncbi:MAG: helix-hairpin-helix domain-containing protein [Spirochaetes bacterium]|nr:helix-hairpin-helix domain-containing protein [Spirochaetota bacterium]